MAKTQETKICERAIYKYSGANGLGVYGCMEVTLGKSYGNERVDFMTMDSEGIFRCYEIKVSKADYLSKAAKTFKGHFNYFVFPEELYEEIKDEESLSAWKASGIGICTVNLKNEKVNNIYKSKKRSGIIFETTNLMHCMIRSLSRYSGIVMAGE